MTREELQTRLAENTEWLRQLKQERARVESQIMALLDENDRIRERLSEFKPILRVIA